MEILLLFGQTLVNHCGTFLCVITEDMLISLFDFSKQPRSQGLFPGLVPKPGKRPWERGCFRSRSHDIPRT